MYGEALGLKTATGCAQAPMMPSPPCDKLPLYQALSMMHNRLVALNEHTQSMLIHIFGTPPSGRGNQTQPANPPSLMEVKRYILDEIERLEQQMQILAATLS